MQNNKKVIIQIMTLVIVLFFYKVCYFLNQNINENNKSLINTIIDNWLMILQYKNEYTTVILMIWYIVVARTDLLEGNCTIIPIVFVTRLCKIPLCSYILVTYTIILFIWRFVTFIRTPCIMCNRCDNNHLRGEWHRGQQKKWISE